MDDIHVTIVKQLDQITVKVFKTSSSAISIN